MIACLLKHPMSTPHMLSLNCEYTFLLLNFLITGLCNSSTKILLFSVRSKELRAKALGSAVDFALPLPDIVFLSNGATFESKRNYIPY